MKPDHKPTMSPEKAGRWNAALKVVTDRLDEAGETYFLDCGTLLGAVRDGSYIPWDNDIDLGVLMKQESAKAYVPLAKRISSHGFNVNLASNSLVCLKSPDVEINVTFYRKTAETWTATLGAGKVSHPILGFIKVVKEGHYHATYGRGGKFALKRALIKVRWLSRIIPAIALDRWVNINVHSVDVPDCHFASFRRRNFNGMQLVQPAEAAGYLAFRYGHGWAVPKKDYCYYRDDGAMRR